MLSFNDYVWTSRMAPVERQIAWNLVVRNQTLGNAIEAVLTDSRLQNEFFGGLLNRIGKAWKTFWHGDSSGGGKDMVTPQEMIALLDNQKQEYLKEIKRLENDLRKNGSSNKEIEQALFEIMKKTGGHYHDIVKKINDESVKNGSNWKPNGIMAEAYKMLSDLNDLTQDPRIPHDDRLKRIEEIEKQFPQLQKKAEEMQSSSDDQDKKEAATVVQQLSSPQIKEMMQDVASLRERLRGHVTKAKEALGNDDDMDSLRVARYGGSIVSLPQDPYKAYEASKNIVGPQLVDSLWAWYTKLPDAQKKAIHDGIFKTFGHRADIPPTNPGLFKAEFYRAIQARAI